MTQRLNLALSLPLLLALGACSQQSDAPTPEPATTAVPDETVSILRPEIEPPEAEPETDVLVPYKAVIGFPDGGSELDANAVASLETALASPQMALGLPITLGAHSDSSGSDTANLNSSEKRGVAVAEWLIANGVEAERITVIAFGEQNPAQPNALPDGAPNDEGRAANRRVEIDIAVPTPEASAPESPEGSNPEGSVEASD